MACQLLLYIPLSFQLQADYRKTLSYAAAHPGVGQICFDAEKGSLLWLQMQMRLSE